MRQKVCKIIFEILIKFFLFIYKDEQKSTMSSASPNLIQKLLFRQFNPKTRPYSLGISVNHF
jgi:hypothetical protein